MIYTSGTTGSRRVPTGGRRQPEQAAAMMQFIGYRPDDVYLTTGPLYHSGPGGFMASALAMGQTIVRAAQVRPRGLAAARRDVPLHHRRSRRRHRSG